MMLSAVQTANGGSWGWWRQGNRIIVGWIKPEAFADDIPAVTVHDARDAKLVADVLTDVQAEPV
ncbi:MAG TPA: hypothetical protein VF506_00445 [Streptosporangiaceae bacterium]